MAETLGRQARTPNGVKRTQFLPCVEPTLPESWDVHNEGGVTFMLTQVDVRPNAMAGISPSMYSVDTLRRAQPDDLGILRTPPEQKHQTHMYLYGRMASGVSVCVHVKGFMPKLVIKLPGVPVPECPSVSAAMAPLIPAGMLEEIERGIRRCCWLPESSPELVVLRPVVRQQFWGWAPSAKTDGGPVRARHVVTLDVHLPSDAAVRRLYNHVVSNRALPHISANLAAQLGGGGGAVTAHEHDHHMFNQFACAAGGKAGGWFHFEAAGLRVPELYSTHQQLELTCALGGVDRSHPRVSVVRGLPERTDVAPVVVLSFDGEMRGEGARFCDASKPSDHIFSWASTTNKLGQDALAHSAVHYFGDAATDDATMDRVLEEVRQRNPTSGKYPIEYPDEIDLRDTEAALLVSWRNYVVFSVNPDVMQGYNNGRFDGPYHEERVKTSGAGPLARMLGRSVSGPAELVQRNIDSASAGQNDQMLWRADGRVVFDLMTLVTGDLKPASNRLDDVANAYLGVGKVHMDFAELNAWRDARDPVKALEAILYNKRDADCTSWLPSKLKVYYAKIAIGRQTFTTLEDVLLEGAARKLFNLVSREARTRGYVMDLPRDSLSFDERKRRRAEQDALAAVSKGGSGRKRTKAYDGGKVFEPTVGFYTHPVATLDFTSLYPSIMIAHNMCYTTLLDERDGSGACLGLAADDVDPVVVSDAATSVFVRDKVTPGLLPTILQELLRERSRVKKQLALEQRELNVVERALAALARAELEGEDAVLAGLRGQTMPEADEQSNHERATEMLEAASRPWNSEALRERADALRLNILVLDALQLAVKLVMNALYGYTGTQGKMLNMRVSAAVTAKGRDMILVSKRIVEKGFPGARVIYGDTDSVMVVVPGADEARASPEARAEFLADPIAHAFKFAKAAAAAVNEHFHGLGYRAINIDFEKIYYPFLLLKKKTYAGLKYTRMDAPDKVDMKGMAPVRRDRCNVVRHVMKRVTDALLMKRDQELAVNEIRDMLRKVEEDALPVEDYFVWRGMNRTYASKEASKEANKRRRIETAASGSALVRALTGGVVDGSTRTGGGDAGAYDAAADADDDDDDMQSNVAQLVVQSKIRARAPGTEPQPGDRFPTVVLESPRNSVELPIAQRNECGRYASANPDKCKIDRVYYLERQVRNLVTGMMSATGVDVKGMFQETIDRMRGRREGQRSIAHMLSSVPLSALRVTPRVVPPDAAVARAAATNRAQPKRLKRDVTVMSAKTKTARLADMFSRTPVKKT